MSTEGQPDPEEQGPATVGLDGVAFERGEDGCSKFGSALGQWETIGGFVVGEVTVWSTIFVIFGDYACGACFAGYFCYYFYFLLLYFYLIIVSISKSDKFNISFISG